MALNHLKWYHDTLKQYLSQDELHSIMQKSNVKAWLEIAHTWAWIAFAFLISGIWPHPFTYIISLFILGGKQLACAIILHDCSHDAMFTERQVNRWVGNIFGAYPILQDVDQYRPYHVQHHMYTGLIDDPDKPLTRGYPTSGISMIRKFARDFSGITGIKSIAGLLGMQLGILEYALNGQTKVLENRRISWLKGFTNLLGPLGVNLGIWAILWSTGHGWLYLLWIGAMLTTFNFSLRVRSMAEHSMVTDASNPHKNTRTVYANFFERILFAPHHVNYHAEHHLCMGAPSYNLSMMHQKLLAKGYYKDGELAGNYWQIVMKAIMPPPTQTQIS